MMPDARFPACEEEKSSNLSHVWDASRGSLRTYHKETQQEDTAVCAVIASYVVSL